MSGVRIFGIVAQLAAILAGCISCVNLAGSGTEAGNGRIIGGITSSEGPAAPNTELLLIPADFTAGDTHFSADTTDSAGHYAFEHAAAGNFSIQGVQHDTRKRILIQEVRVDPGRTTVVDPDSVRVTGSIRIVLPDSMRTDGGKIILQGTTYGVSTTGDSSVVIDSLPSGAMPDLMFLAPGEAKPAAVISGYSVQAGDTTVLSAIARKTIRIQPGDDLQAAINKLLPGDSLLLAGGTYEHTGISVSLCGNVQQPITIAAMPGENPVMRITVETANCIDINGAAWLTLEGITIDSTPVDVDGIKFTEFGACHHVTIRNCTLHAVQATGINAQGGHYAITLSSNHIYDVSGDAVSGIRIAPAATSAAPHGWTIANNWVHTIGDSLSSAAFGISLNSGCQSMIVRDNVVYAAGNSGIIVYGVGTPTSDGALSSIVEGNAVWNAPEGISAYCDVIVRNNVIFDCPNPVYSYSYQGAIPRNVLIYSNTMYNGEAPYLRSWDTTNNCVFVNNAVYAMTGGFVLIGNGHIANNAGDVTAAGFIVGTASTDLSDPAGRNFYPKSGSVLIDRGDRTISSSVDFNGNVRDSLPDAGAYEFSGGSNPGWTIREGFKER
jgi:hypothetical protein